MRVRTMLFSPRDSEILINFPFRSVPSESRIEFFQSCPRWTKNQPITVQNFNLFFIFASLMNSSQSSQFKQKNIKLFAAITFLCKDKLNNLETKHSIWLHYILSNIILSIVVGLIRKIEASVTWESAVNT